MKKRDKKIIELEINILKLEKEEIEKRISILKKMLHEVDSDNNPQLLQE